MQLPFDLFFACIPQFLAACRTPTRNFNSVLFRFYHSFNTTQFAFYFAFLSANFIQFLLNNPKFFYRRTSTLSPPYQGGGAPTQVGAEGGCVFHRGNFSGKIFKLFENFLF